MKKVSCINPAAVHLFRRRHGHCMAGAARVGTKAAECLRNGLLHFTWLWISGGGVIKIRHRLRPPFRAAGNRYACLSQDSLRFVCPVRDKDAKTASVLSRAEADPLHSAVNSVPGKQILALHSICDWSDYNYGPAHSNPPSVLVTGYAVGSPFDYFLVSSTRHTAWAAMPSPEPVKPRPSSVVALTLTLPAGMPQTAAIFLRICKI